MVRKINRWLGATTALAASLFLWSCDNMGDLTRPELEPSPMVVTSTTGQKYVVAYEENPASGSVSATIGPEGGVLGMGPHAVWVSKGAVSEPTEFTMSRSAEEPLRVKLTAGADNQVGAKGFAAPVRLTLYMGNVTNLPASRRDAKIVYYRSDGLIEVLETRVIGMLAVADLPHFSLFGIAWP